VSGPGCVLIVSPNWLGDAVMALPAIADVRRRYPASRLIVAARTAVADLFAMAPMVDAVLTMEWRGRVLQRGALRSDIARLRQAAADAALLLPNSFASAWMVKQAGVGDRWGYATDLRRPLLSRAVPTPRGSVHQAEYYQHLVRALGIESGPRTSRVSSHAW
jgi:heptosyltransferase II